MKRQKRGQYSPIMRVLLDGPDYQRLSPVARHTFLVLKVMFGPSGIEVRYPSALSAELAHVSGWGPVAVDQALAELQDAGWIDREAHVVWLLGHLNYHPSMSADNEKHRTGIQDHVGGLPRLSIVRRFIEAHGPYFVDRPDVLAVYPQSTGPALTLVATDAGKGNVTLSYHAVRSTQHPLPNTQDEKPSCASVDAPGDDPLLLFEDFWIRYPRRKGTNSLKAAERCWRARVKEGESQQTMLDGCSAYAAHCRAEGKVGTPFVMQASRFLGPDKHYRDLDGFAVVDSDEPAPPLVDGFGCLTEYGKASTELIPNERHIAALRDRWRQSPEGMKALDEWQEKQATAKKLAAKKVKAPRSAEIAAAPYAAALGGQ